MAKSKTDKAVTNRPEDMEEARQEDYKDLFEKAMKENEKRSERIEQLEVEVANWKKEARNPFTVEGKCRIMSDPEGCQCPKCRAERAEAEVARLKGKSDREKIFLEVEDERIRQDKKWGGPQHDDTHDSFDWVVYLTKHIGRAVVYANNRGEWDHEIYRKQMVRVAALAVAAIEWLDRKGKYTTFFK